MSIVLVPFGRSTIRYRSIFTAQPCAAKGDEASKMPQAAVDSKDL
jgi:hypothetical protein